MKTLHIEPSQLTPGVIFDPSHGRFEMNGSSRPEDVRTFYEPILSWLDELMRTELGQLKSKSPPGNPLVVTMRLDYFNSSSAKYIFDILQSMNQIGKEGVAVRIDWHYLEEDEDMLEAGRELAGLLETEFNFIEMND